MLHRQGQEQGLQGPSHSQLIPVAVRGCAVLLSAPKGSRRNGPGAESRGERLPHAVLRGAGGVRGLAEGEGGLRPCLLVAAVGMASAEREAVWSPRPGALPPEL